MQQNKDKEEDDAYITAGRSLVVWFSLAGGLWIPGFIIAVICVAVLVLIFVLVYKRKRLTFFMCRV